MAIAFRSQTSLGGTAASVSVIKPSGALADEILVVDIVTAGATVSAVPSGWTQITNVQTGLTARLFSYWHLVGASDPGPWAFTLSVSGAYSHICACYSGVDTTTPLDVAATTVGNNTAGASIVVPAVSPVTANTMLHSGVGEGATNRTITMPTGMTTIVEVTVGRRQEAAWQAIAATGTTGTRTWTFSGTAVYNAYMVPLRPSSGTTASRTVPATLGVQTTNTRVVTATLGVDAPAPSAVTFRAGATTQTVTGTSPGSITIPSGAQVGDVALIGVAHDDALVTMTTPSGWTLTTMDAGSNPQASTASDTSTQVFHRVLQAGDPGSAVTLAFSAAANAVVGMAVFAGNDTTTPIREARALGYGAATGTHTTSTITPQTGDAVFIALSMDKSASTFPGAMWEPGSGITQVWDAEESGSFETGFGGYALVTSGGATTYTVTSNDTDESAIIAVVIAVGTAGATFSRTVPATLGVQETRTRTVSATLGVQRTNVRAVPSTVGVQTTQARIVPATIGVQTTLIRTVPATLGIAVPNTLTRLVPATLGVQRTQTRSLAATVGIQQTNVRNVAATLGVQRTNSRAVPATLGVQTNQSRIMPSTIGVQTSNVRIVSATTGVQIAAARIIPSTIGVQAAVVRAVPSTLGVSVTGSITRIVPATLGVQTAKARTIPATLGIQTTQARIIPATVGVMTVQRRTVLATIGVNTLAVRAIPATLGLTIAGTRTVPATIGLQTVGVRTVPATLGIVGAFRRIVPATIGTATGVGIPHVIYTAPSPPGALSSEGIATLTAPAPAGNLSGGN